MKYTSVYDSPVGRLGVVTTDEALTRLEFAMASSLPSLPSTGYDELVAKALDTYFATDQQSLPSLNIEVSGTAFQKRVWQALRQIPSGQTQTYGEVSQMLLSSPRAVGNACRKNPVIIFTPCHRVVSATGLGGFAGQTEGALCQVKDWLLTHEQQYA